MKKTEDADLPSLYLTFSKESKSKDTLYEAYNN